MFPFFPFGPVPPFPFLFPFGRLPWPGMGMGTAPSGHADAAEGTEPASPFGVGPASMMSMAMMPAMAPFALGTHLAQAAEDARRAALHVRDSLERDDGPVHVVVGDPDGPLGLAIGLTFMKGGQRPALRDVTGAGAPQLTSMVDVTPAAE